MTNERSARLGLQTEGRNTVSHMTWTPPRAPLPLCPGFLCLRGTGLASDVSFQAPGSQESFLGTPRLWGGCWESLTKAGMHHSQAFQIWDLTRPYPYPAPPDTKLELPQAWRNTTGNSPSRQDRADTRHVIQEPTPPTPRVIQHSCWLPASTASHASRVG